MYKSNFVLGFLTVAALTCGMVSSSEANPTASFVRATVDGVYWTTGTGFLVSEKGYIITSRENLLIQGVKAKQIEVSIGSRGGHFKPAWLKWCGYNVTTEICLLGTEVEDIDKSLKPALPKLACRGLSQRESITVRSWGPNDHDPLLLTDGRVVGPLSDKFEHMVTLINSRITIGAPVFDETGFIVGVVTGATSPTYAEVSPLSNVRANLSDFGIECAVLPGRRPEVSFVYVSTSKQELSDQRQLLRETIFELLQEWSFPLKPTYDTEIYPFIEDIADAVFKTPDPSKIRSALQSEAARSLDRRLNAEVIYIYLVRLDQRRTAVGGRTPLSANHVVLKIGHEGPNLKLMNENPPILPLYPARTNSNVSSELSLGVDEVEKAAGWLVRDLASAEREKFGQNGVIWTFCALLEAAELPEWARVLPQALHDSLKRHWPRDEALSRFSFKYSDDRECGEMYDITNRRLSAEEYRKEISRRTTQRQLLMLPEVLLDLQITPSNGDYSARAFLTQIGMPRRKLTQESIPKRKPAFDIMIRKITSEFINTMTK